jgi:hypothetical protein
MSEVNHGCHSFVFMSEIIFQYLAFLLFLSVAMIGTLRRPEPKLLEIKEWHMDMFQTGYITLRNEYQLF